MIGLIAFFFRWFLVWDVGAEVSSPGWLVVFGGLVGLAVFGWFWRGTRVPRFLFGSIGRLGGVYLTRLVFFFPRLVG